MRLCMRMYINVSGFLMRCMYACEWDRSTATHTHTDTQTRQEHQILSLVCVYSLCVNWLRSCWFQFFYLYFFFAFLRMGAYYGMRSRPVMLL